MSFLAEVVYSTCATLTIVHEVNCFVFPFVGKAGQLDFTIGQTSCLTVDVAHQLSSLLLTQNGMDYFKLLNASKLSVKEIELFKYEFDRLSKKTWLAYVLFLFTGAFGGHEFYLNQASWGALRLFSFVIMIAGIMDAASSEDGTIFFVGMGVWGFMAVKLLWDLFTIPESVKKLNRKLEKRMLESITGRTLEEPKMEKKAKASKVESHSMVTAPTTKSSDAQILGILGWIFGCILAAAGIGGLFMGDATSAGVGLLWLLCGLWAIPPLAEKVDAKVKVPTLAKVVIIIVLFFGGGMAMPSEVLEDTSNSVTEVDATVQP